MIVKARDLQAGDYVHFWKATVESVEIDGRIATVKFAGLDNAHLWNIATWHSIKIDRRKNDGETLKYDVYVIIALETGHAKLYVNGVTVLTDHYDIVLEYVKDHICEVCDVKIDKYHEDMKVWQEYKLEKPIEEEG